MKLVSDALSPTKLLLRIEERLRMRGIRSTMSDELSRSEAPVEVDVWRHFLESLSEDVHADRVDDEALGSGTLRRFRELLRVPLQPVISSVLQRQVRFNGHVTETYAHLAAEVQRLESEVRSLREELVEGASRMKKAQRALAKAQEEAEKQAQKAKKARKAQEAEAEAKVKTPGREPGTSTEREPQLTKPTTAKPDAARSARAALVERATKRANAATGKNASARGTRARPEASHKGALDDATVKSRTAETATDGAKKSATGDTPKAGTANARKTTPRSAKKPATGSSKKPATGSAKRPAAGGSKKTETGTSKKPATGSSKKPATASAKKPATTRSKKTAPTSAETAATDSSKKPATGSTGKARTAAKASPSTSKASAETTRWKPQRS